MTEQPYVRILGVRCTSTLELNINAKESHKSNEERCSHGEFHQMENHHESIRKTLRIIPINVGSDLEVEKFLTPWGRKQTATFLIRVHENFESHFVLK